MSLSDIHAFFKFCLPFYSGPTAKQSGGYYITNIIYLLAVTWLKVSWQIELVLKLRSAILNLPGMKLHLSESTIAHH